MKLSLMNLIRKLHLNKIDDALREFLADLSSLKALWNHIYLTFYIVLCWYVVKHNLTSHATVITITGGVVSVIFTSYVIGSVIEKVKQVGKHTPKLPVNETEGPISGGEAD